MGANIDLNLPDQCYDEHICSMTLDLGLSLNSFVGVFVDYRMFSFDSQEGKMNIFIYVAMAIKSTAL